MCFRYLLFYFYLHVHKDYSVLLYRSKIVLITSIHSFLCKFLCVLFRVRVKIKEQEKSVCVIDGNFLSYLSS